MANQRSEKFCFESRYGGGWITANQRLAEIACERIAGETTLSSRFWTNPPWDKIFRAQVTHASKLLISFRVDAVMKTLASPKGLRVKSLGAPFLLPLIEIEQHKLDLAAQALESAPLPENVNTLETPRPIKRAGRSIREKLADSNAPNERGLFNSDSENTKDD